MKIADGTAIILEGHTLGIVRKNQFQILRASVLRGSPYSNQGCLTFDASNDLFQFATCQDFDDYRVMWHPDYIISKNPKVETVLCEPNPYILMLALSQTR